MSDKRSDILQATLNLISEYGFHDAPMSKIAAQASVGVGTIYRYFDGKEALINELFLEVKRELTDAMLVGYTFEVPLEEQFRTLWLNTFYYCIQHPEEMLFIEQYHKSPFLTPQTEAETMHYLAPILQSFGAGIERGDLKPLTFEMLTALTTDVAFALAHAHLSSTQVMDEDSLDLAVGACWDAIKS
jgi:AcrR family transcriptional regulator